ncbi:hypothetical protein D6C92_10213, partial [Aureobasidium pullulans]
GGLVATPSETIQLCSSQGSIQDINKELLCYFSKYYRAALNGRFAEAHQQIFNVDLSGQQLRVFTAWIYTGQLELLKWNREDRLMLYVFADFAEILALRRQIMTEEGRMERYKEVGLAITHLPDNSPYRRRIVDHYARHWKAADDRGATKFGHADGKRSSTETIDLISIGKKHMATVSKDLLCLFSRYYAAALNGSFKEAEETRFSIPLTSHQLVLFVGWLYSGTTYTCKFSDMLELYFFADSHKILAFRRSI